MKKITALIITILLSLTMVAGMTVFAAPGDLTVTLKFDSSGGDALIPDAYIVLKADDGTGTFRVDPSLTKQTDVNGVCTWAGLDHTVAYKIEVQAGEDYDKKEIDVSVGQISAGHSVVIDVPFVVRGNYLTMYVEDGLGAPLEGVDITLGAYDTQVNQVFEVNGISDVNGRIRFYDMVLENILSTVIVKSGETIVGTNDYKWDYMEAIELGGNPKYQSGIPGGNGTDMDYIIGYDITQSIVNIVYPTVEVHGTVTDLSGNPVEGQRVVSKKEGSSIERIWWSDVWYIAEDSSAYAAYTDENGDYTMMLPNIPGEQYEICGIDKSRNLDWELSGMAKEYDEFVPHRKSVHKEIQYKKAIINGTGAPMYGYDLELTQNYTLKAKFINNATGAAILGNVGIYPDTSASTHSGGIGNLWSITGGNLNTIVSFPAGNYTISRSGYFSVPCVINQSDIVNGIVDLGVISFIEQPITPRPPAIGSGSGSGGSWNTKPSNTPAYGWLSTRLEKVDDLALGYGSYEVTLHYRGWHNSGTVIELDNVNIEIQLPDGISASVVPADMSYDSGTNIISKNIPVIDIQKDYKDVFSITVDPDVPQNYFVINANVTIDNNPKDFTAVLTLQRSHITLIGPRIAKDGPFKVFGDITGAGGGTGVQIVNSLDQFYASTYKDGRWYQTEIGPLALGVNYIKAKTIRNSVTEYSIPLRVETGNNLTYVTDSYINTSEGYMIPKSVKRDVPSYTSFIDIDKKVKDFEICTEIANTTAGDTVKFTVLGEEYPAILDTDGYWKADITDLHGYGDHEIMVNINGKETLAGTLLLLFYN